MTPFDVAKNINQKTGVLDDVAINDAYMLNAIFANTQDTVLLANESNRFISTMPKNAAYRFLYGATLKNPRRFGKWFKKPVADSDIKLIMEIYGYSKTKAIEVFPLLETKMPELKKLFDTGGVRK